MHHSLPFFLKSLTLFIFFTLAAIAGNYFNIQFFWGIQALFGSIAMLIAICFYGAGWGLGVALLSGGATVLLSSDPGMSNLMLAQVGEALAVGLAYRRLSRNLVMLDGIFWLLLGMPFIALSHLLDNNTAMPLILTLRAGINGVFNAMLVSLLVQAAILWRWYRTPCEAGGQKRSISLRQLLFNLLVTVALTPALLVAVLDSQQQYSIMQMETKDELKFLSKTVIDRLAQAPDDSGAATELMHAASPHEQQKIDFTLIDAFGSVVASSRPEISPGGVYDPHSSGETRKIGATIYEWLPPQEGRTAAQRWEAMRSVMETPLNGADGGKLIAEISSSFYQQEVLVVLARSMSILSGIIVLAFLLGWLLSRWLTNPLIQLAKETHNLHFTFLDTHTLELPDSPLDEMEKLVLNFRETAKTLHKSFSELYGFNELLEMRVEERTREFLEANRQLKEEIAAGIEQARRLRITAAELETQKFALDQHSIVAITDANNIITYANDKFCEVSQFSREELIGQDHRIVNSGYHPEAFFKEMRGVIGRGQVWKGVIRNRRKDGSFYWVDTTIVPFMDANGQPYQYVAIRTDITERQRSGEDLKRAKEAAEAANRAKSEFLSRMSHELRTPLNAIIGFTQILESEVDGKLTEGQRESTANVLLASWHLLDLISEILDLARIESGRMAMTLEEVDLAPLVSECVDMIAPLANERHILIDDRITQGEDMHRVQADRTRLKQVMLNLMSNAVKYNTMEGSVQLTCKRVAGGWLRINVTDSGIGIPADKLDELFKPFSRLNADKSEIQGAGVGLAVTKSLVELMGGRIGVESVTDGNTTFWVELMDGGQARGGEE